MVPYPAAMCISPVPLWTLLVVVRPSGEPLLAGDFRASAGFWAAQRSKVYFCAESAETSFDLAELTALADPQVVSPRDVHLLPRPVIAVVQGDPPPWLVASRVVAVPSALADTFADVQLLLTEMFSI